MAIEAMTLSTQQIEAVCQIWQEGSCIGMPTETVYGLAADATNDRAVANIYALKERPSFNPLIAHVANQNMAEELVEWNALCELLVGLYWPGPLTLIRPKKATCNVSSLCTAGGEYLAVRMPSHPIAQQLLQAYGKAVAAPSANKSGRVSPTCAAHVHAEFGQTLHVVDGGACKQGVESTILWVEESQVSILRPGSVTNEMLIAQTIDVKKATNKDMPSAPGQLQSHYAPNLPVRMNAEIVKEGEALLGFSDVDATLNLSPCGDIVEAAANLFAYLRQLDDPQYTAIAVSPIPLLGLGVAINDRLRRAEAPRG